jgi:hypothetical protein
MADTTDTAIQDDVDTISLAIQECDDQPRAHAAQCALNRLIGEIERLRAEIGRSEQRLDNLWDEMRYSGDDA